MQPILYHCASFWNYLVPKSNVGQAVQYGSVHAIRLWGVRGVVAMRTQRLVRILHVGADCLA
jgi:hypothetical protein